MTSPWYRALYRTIRLDFQAHRSALSYAIETYRQALSDEKCLHAEAEFHCTPEREEDQSNSNRNGIMRIFTGNNSSYTDADIFKILFLNLALYIAVALLFVGGLYVLNQGEITWDSVFGLAIGIAICLAVKDTRRAGRAVKTAILLDEMKVELSDVERKLRS